MAYRRTLSLLVPPALLMAPAFAQKASHPAAEQQAAFLQGPHWRQLLEDVGGSWRVEWSAATGTPKAIWGSGMPLADWRENSLVEARRHAQQLLRERSELLQLGTSEFREATSGRMGRTWAFTFDQYFKGLRVVGGRADVRINMSGRVPLFGSTAFPVPAGFAVVPQLGADMAEALAWQAAGTAPNGVVQPGTVAAPQLVIWGDAGAAAPSPVRLAWQVTVSNVAADGSGPIGRYFIDALTGAVLSHANDKHECGFAGCTHRSGSSGDSASALPVLTTVTVRGFTRTGLDGASALVNVPLPGLQLNVPGFGVQTTDANGQFTINIVSSVTITANALDGRHHNAISGAAAPSASVTVTPGVPATLQLLTAGATADQAAHTTTSWWTDRTNEWARSILGNSPQLNTASNIAATVNIGSTCNAYYTGNSINFYSAGGGCNNTAFSTVVAHEWGHGLDDRYGGISQTNGLSEGWADICAFYLTDQPVLAASFFTSGAALRDGNNTQQYPGGSGPHGQGQSWMGFAWKLRNRLATTLGNRPAAVALTEDIVVGSIVANAQNQADAVLEVFVADDNDGNLLNGTPNSPDLIWACNQHSLPYPGAGGGIPNDECATALAVVNGVNGPFSNVGAATSAPAWPCAAGGNDVWFVYTVQVPGTLTVRTCGQAAFDTALQVFSGTCAGLTSLGCIDDACASVQSELTVSVGTGTHYIRVGGYNGASGAFSLDVSGPVGVPAASVPFGSGCYRTSRSFYELFASTGFDLSGSAMRLVRNAAGFYVAQPGGGYVAPTAAAQSLSLGDDSFASVTLAGTLQYPGGSTSTLEVCSNGFVSAATGNGAGFTPTAAGWLGSSQARWGTWHDFNPAIAGSGSVKFEQIGTVAYVTWDGVYSFATTSPNTWQLQFDLTTGNVTCAWSSVISDGNGWLVGFTAAGSNLDLGSLDISAALPGTFRTSAANTEALSLSGTLPTLGNTLTLTTSQFPASSVLGIQQLGLTQYNPGLDLTAIGMAGCRQHASLDVLELLFPVGGQATYLMTIPNNPTLQGFSFTAQSVAFVTGANAQGLITSNGVQLTVGI